MELYQELTIEQQTLRGMLYKPNTEKKVPLVLLLHGFTGNRIDSKFIFVSFSRYLKERNIASLRFDFLGSGESDGEFKEMTFLKEVKQAHRILDYAKTLDFVSEIILMGFSMGGAVASYISKDRVDDIDKLILWSPAGNMASLANQYFNTIPKLTNGNVDLGGLELGKDFYLELRDLDLLKDIEKFNKSVCICHGSNDQAVPLEIGQEYHKKYKNSVLYPIDNADHVYSGLEYRKKLFQTSHLFIVK